MEKEKKDKENREKEEKEKKEKEEKEREFQSALAKWRAYGRSRMTGSYDSDDEEWLAILS